MVLLVGFIFPSQPSAANLDSTVLSGTETLHGDMPPMASDQSMGHLPASRASLGNWLPEHRSVKRWVAMKLKDIEENGSVALDPAIIALRDLVAESPHLTRLSRDMFTQIPPAYQNDPTGKPQIRNFEKMLELLNSILKEGPEWTEEQSTPTAIGLVSVVPPLKITEPAVDSRQIGFPINAILDWPMGTSAGYQFFLHAEVNIKLRAILNTWGRFLKSRESLRCLDEDRGWLSTEALRMLAAEGNNGRTHYTFEQLYACNPSVPYFGFKSWDDFFTRKFNPGVRPVAFPDDVPTSEQPDPKNVIVNACESTALQFATNVKLHDTFWLKEQPYSLADMLDNHPLADQFTGGSVYQAFLNALTYHCWHAPVSGKVVDILTVAGTYYSENLYQGFGNAAGPDASAANGSQPYISAVAARGIIFIQADNPTIGLMAIVFIGMAEVSSCDFTINKGDRITKGQLIGMFHFGGSTHCMVFRPETGLTANYFIDPPPWQHDGPNNPVNGTLAILKPKVVSSNWLRNLLGIRSGWPFR